MAYNNITEGILRRSVYLGTKDPLDISYQASHGFVVGDIIRMVDNLDGTYVFYKAIADNIDTTYVIGIVSEVLSADKFRYKSDGYILPTTLFTYELGKYYYLSEFILGAKTYEKPTIPILVGFGTDKGFKVEISNVTDGLDPRLFKSGIKLYLHSEDNDSSGLSDYDEARLQEPDDPSTTYIVGSDDSSVDSLNTILIKEWITEPDFPNIDFIPAGPWIFEHWMAVDTLDLNNPDDYCSVIVEVHKCDADGSNELLLFTFEQDITTVAISQYLKIIPNNQFEMGVGKRIKFSYYAKFGVISNNVYLSVEGNESAEWWWSSIQLPISEMKYFDDKYVSDAYFTESNRMLILVRTGGLPDIEVEIPEQDIPACVDNYVDGATFDETTRNLTLQRTGVLSDIVVNIPCDIVDVVQGAVTNVKYGYLYNWWAASDARNIAPVGWHVPTLAEYQTLYNYLGTSGFQDKVKEENINYWNDITDITNSAKWNGRGSGYRHYGTGAYSGSKVNGWFGCINTTNWARLELTSGDHDASVTTSSNEKYGFAIRYIKDDSTDPGTVTGNDGKVYPTVTIGTQVWTAANSAETKYRDGSLITGPTFTNIAWVALTTEAYCIYEDNPDNAIDGIAVEHNLLSGLQGGNTTERFHHTADEIIDHVYEAPIDSNQYVRKNGAWEELILAGLEIGDWLEDITFEYKDIEAGTAQTYYLDPLATFHYIIIGVVVRSDDTMSALEIQINGTPVEFGSSTHVDVTTSAVRTYATDAFTVVEDDVVTLVTSGTDGDPTELRGKLIIQRT
jgi:uncharacterized protein (TIGR02145 family)